MTTPLTITFPIKLFNPEKFGLSKAQAASDPGRLAESVAEVLGEIFRKIGQNARIAVTPYDTEIHRQLNPVSLISCHHQEWFCEDRTCQPG